jgi:putative transposase
MEWFLVYRLITLLKSPSHNIGAIVRGYKSAVTRQVNSLNNVETVWHRNFYENIIRDGRAYELISNYIISNPQNWQEDKFYIK